jgi:hypothetical protein
MLFNLVRIHRIEGIKRMLEVHNKRITPAPGKVLADDDPHELHLLRVRGHCVRGHDPAAFAQLVRDGELVVQVLAGRVQAAGDEGQALAMGLGEDYEAELFEGGGEVVGGADQVAKMPG